VLATNLLVNEKIMHELHSGVFSQKKKAITTRCISFTLHNNSLLLSDRYTDSNKHIRF
jgi:hypothetical protein